MIIQNISASKLHKNDGNDCIQSHVMTSNEYPLCGSILTAAEDDKIDRSYLPNVILTRMGFNSRTKRLLFLGPIVARFLGNWFFLKIIL